MITSVSGTLVAIVSDSVCLWTSPNEKGEQRRVAWLARNEVLLVIAITVCGSGSDAMVVSPSTGMIGYVNVKALSEVGP